MFYRLDGIDEAMAIGPRALDGSEFTPPRPAPWEQKRASIIVPYFQHESIPESIEDLPDVLSPGLCLAVSNRVYRVLDASQLSEGVTISPLRVWNRNNKIVGEFYLLWSSIRLNVIDEEHSTLKRYPDGRIMRVEKCVLQKDALPKCDVFMSEQYEWYISKNLCVCFREMGLSGCHILGPTDEI